MAERTITCPNCGAQFQLMHHKRARWMATGAGAVLGVAATRSLLGGVLMGALSYGIATMIDQYHAKRCPECAIIVSRPDDQPQARRGQAAGRQEQPEKMQKATRREEQPEQPEKARKTAKREEQPEKAQKARKTAKREEQAQKATKAKTAKQAS